MKKVVLVAVAIFSLVLTTSCTDNIEEKITELEKKELLAGIEGNMSDKDEESEDKE